MLQEIRADAIAQKLLQDVPSLRKWQEMPKPTHAVRDAMMNLGTQWEVPQKTQGKKHPPAEVARQLDEAMRKKAKELLGSVASTRMQVDSDKPSTTSTVATFAPTDQGPQPTLILHTGSETPHH